jgi:RNA polymerase sigma-70 factor (ECF subfamily)
MQDGESNVLDRFRQGDVDAFETLFRMHQRTVFRWALRIVRDRSAAEDVTLEAFWRIHHAHARFDPARGFEPWARRIATHAAIDWMRRRRPEVNVPQQTLDSAAATCGSDSAISAEIRRKTAAAFGHLSANLRATAVLALVEELPQKEVADALGITVTAVKVRLFRALRLLRRDLTEMGIRP